MANGVWKKKLTWRDVLDCKVIGMNRNLIAEEAKKLSYEYFCHNGRVFSVTNHEEVCLAEALIGSGSWVEGKKDL